jgi:hypothetical protein
MRGRYGSHIVPSSVLREGFDGDLAVCVAWEIPFPPALPTSGIWRLSLE